MRITPYVEALLQHKINQEDTFDEALDGLKKENQVKCQ